MLQINVTSRDNAGWKHLDLGSDRDFGWTVTAGRSMNLVCALPSRFKHGIRPRRPPLPPGE
jgi:hypothetical protein